jgi:transketolase
MDSKSFLYNIRKNALSMVHLANASHIGSCLSIAHILTILYNEILEIDLIQSNSNERDRFVLSKGHATAILYATLAEVNLIPKSELATYCQKGSRLLGHSSHHVPGIEFSTGSLGHGLPYSTGIAWGLKCKGSKAKSYCLVSDGEMDEGSNWEAILFAGHHKLNNLVLIIDYNKIQSLGNVKDVLDLEPFVSKLESFLWNVIELDGHDFDVLRKTFEEINQNDSFQTKPTVILAHTIKGKDIPFMENNNIWHYKSPSVDQLEESFNVLKNL